VAGVSDDRVEVAEQEQPAVAASGQAGEEIVGVLGARAGQALDLDLARKQRRDHGDRLLGAGEVAGGRGDADESLELAFGMGGDPLRRRGYPGCIERFSDPRDVRSLGAAEYN
jgi:hypothetical protein